ncbi:MAG: hypothetical protein ACRDWX_12185 [Acidimicrobiia bacterium]
MARTWGRGPFPAMRYWRAYVSAARRFPKLPGPAAEEEQRQRRRFPLAAEREVTKLPTR